MKIQVKTTKNLIVEIEGETQKDLFAELASAHEVFGETTCGICSSEHIVPVVRKVTKVSGKKLETFEYPEFQCRDCGARLSLAYNLEGGRMFVNRKLLPESAPGKNDGQPATGDNREKGVFTKTRGWTKFKGEKKEE